jgi:hypothetical protein
LGSPGKWKIQARQWTYEATAMTMYRARLKRWYCWLLAPLPLLLPMFLIPRVKFLGNRDALFYGNILALTTDALRAGGFYTRWFADANASMGSVVMMFYAPLAYIATALIELPLAGLHPDWGTRFVLGIYASQVLCGVTAFAWLKHHFSMRTALAGSLLYVLLPFKFNYIYDPPNFAQLWALALLPLWMLGVEKLVAGGGARASAMFALAGAATYYTHPLTVLAFGAVPVCYTLWFARRRRAVWLWFALACGLMACLCLMLAWPQAQYRDWIREDGFLSGKYDWRRNLFHFHIDIFLYAYYGVIAALVGWAATRCRAIKDSGKAGPSLFWICILAAVFFLNMPFSAFLWEHVPVLRYLQFPAARLHCAALIAVVFLICVWLEHYKEMLPLSPTLYRLRTLAALIAVFGIATFGRIFLIYATYIASPPDYIAAMRAAHVVSPPEYRTRWGCVDPGHALDLYRKQPVPAPLTAGEGTTLILQEWHPPQRIAFTADVKAAQAGIAVRQCYVPAWEAFDSGRSVPLGAAGPDGLIQITLPQGRHTVELRLAETRSMVYARWAGAVSLVLCLMLLMLGPRVATRAPLL